MFVLGFIDMNYNLLIHSIVVFWISNLVYSCQKFSFRYLFFVFNIVIFLFFISRPFINSLNKSKIIQRNYWNCGTTNENLFALGSIYLSLICILIGYNINEKILNKNYKIIKKESYVYNLEFVSLVMFYISMCFLFLVEIEKFMYMRGRNYEEIYVSFSTKLPLIINIFASMCKYFLCIFLACFPKKSKAFLPLCLYVISTVPYFLIGARHKLVESVLFAIVYYIIREILSLKEKNIKNEWFGAFEKSALCLGIPMGMALLGAHNYIRENKKLEIKNILNLIVDFFYKQGVSFDVLRMGYSAIPKIKYTGFVNYSFADILDYIFYGNIAQILFGVKPLGIGQNEAMGLYSNQLAHRLAYTIAKDFFLAGHGWGSTYILDSYADWGYTGIIIFSLAIGFLFGLMAKYISNKKSLARSIILVILTGIFYCPRTSSFRWISFLVYAQYYIPVIICFVGAKLLSKNHNINLSKRSFNKID